jgi:hypothetical protein
LSRDTGATWQLKIQDTRRYLWDVVISGDGNKVLVTDYWNAVLISRNG